MTNLIAAFRNFANVTKNDHPASYSMGTGDTSPEVKRPGREAEASPPRSVEVKNT